MFEKLIREIKQLDKSGISIPIDTDENGFFDKECPDEECMFVFKVHEEDWKK